VLEGDMTLQGNPEVPTMNGDEVEMGLLITK
jgi:hypothetical protein